MECVFCLIVAGKIPAAEIYRDKHCVAIMDIQPLCEGHFLLMPTHHAEVLTELSDEAAGGMLALLPRLGRALLAVTQAAGFNVLQNNGRAAGQVVPHVHFHLIPRNLEDGLGYRWNAQASDSARLADLAARMRAAL